MLVEVTNVSKKPVMFSGPGVTRPDLYVAVPNPNGKDPDCVHVIARNEQGLPVGTGRLQKDGRIGRLAVLKDWRGKGVGTELLCTLIEAAHGDGIQELFLHAQVDAIPFYEKQGFARTGDIFIEANIKHITMKKKLDR